MSGSVWKVTHAVLLFPKLHWFAGQALAVQAPLRHFCPLAHALPQLPQWFGLLFLSTTCPLHTLSVVLK